MSSSSPPPSGEGEVAVVIPQAPPMPRYQHEDAAEVAPQLSETPESLAEKVASLAKAVRHSKYLVVYSGAGISTAAGVPDFRGERGLDKVGWMSALAGQGVGPAGSDVLLPTYAHAAVTELHRRGIVKYVVTSNHDNFHMMSGLPASAVTAIFGNGNTESCLKCHKTFIRRTQVPQLGRTCDDQACSGRLKKHGVRFGGQINTEAWEESHRQARAADVALVLGSGMGVSPFCNFPTKSKKGAYLCALQATPYDQHRKVKAKINATCDEVMRGLMRALDIPVPDLHYSQPLRLLAAAGPFAVGAHALSLTDPSLPGNDDGDDSKRARTTLRLVSRSDNEAPTCVSSVALLVTGAGSADAARTKAEGMLARVATGEEGRNSNPRTAAAAAAAGAAGAGAGDSADTEQLPLAPDEDDDDDELGTAFEEHRLHYELEMPAAKVSSAAESGTWVAVRVRYRREYVWPSHAIVVLDTAAADPVADWTFERRAAYPQ